MTPITKKGFTLVEILVYIAVLAIIGVAVSSLFLWAVHSNTKARVMRETLWNTHRVMDIMTIEIREASGIYTPTTTPTQLSLETTTYVPAGETASFVDFFLCGTQLCEKREGQDPIALTAQELEITNLEFLEVATASSTASIQITLQVEYLNPNNRSELEAVVELVSTASMRLY